MHSFRRSKSVANNKKTIDQDNWRSEQLNQDITDKLKE
jgi:hypothetical protein